MMASKRECLGFPPLLCHHLRAVDNTFRNAKIGSRSSVMTKPLITLVKIPRDCNVMESVVKCSTNGDLVVSAHFCFNLPIEKALIKLTHNREIGIDKR